MNNEFDLPREPDPRRLPQAELVKTVILPCLISGSVVIDWSKKPEGATHYEHGTLDRSSGFMQQQRAGVWNYWCPILHAWCADAAAPRYAHLFVPAPVIWDGEGYPPAGAECELRQKTGGWGHAEIKYISLDVCVWLWVRPTAMVRQIEHGADLKNLEFRLVRTPEQIESDARLESMRLQSMRAECVQDWLSSVEQQYGQDAADQCSEILKAAEAKRVAQ